MFESSVNLQGNETKNLWNQYNAWFESSVNLQGNETDECCDITQL